MSMGPPYVAYHAVNAIIVTFGVINPGKEYAAAP
jgi:hypothetical protein